MGTLFPGLRSRLLPCGRDTAGDGHLTSIQPPASLCSCFSNSLTREKGVLGHGYLWGCGDASH